MPIQIFPEFLWRKLIRPLAIMVLVVFVLAMLVPWRGLFINLTTTLLGILLIIGYVDRVQKTYEEKERWAVAMELIKKRIDHFAIVSFSNFRAAFHIGPEIIDQGAIDIDNQSSIRAEMTRVIERMLPAVKEHVRKMTKNDWKNLIPQLQATYKWADDLGQLYGFRVEPDVLVLTMKIQNEMEGIAVLYAAFPDVIGIPDDQLPTKRDGTSAIKDRIGMENVISSNITNILTLASALLKKLDEDH